MTPAQNPAPFPKDTIKAAIADGKALIKDGKTKVEATTAMYAKLEALDTAKICQNDEREGPQTSHSLCLCKSTLSS
jgi:hypothetical protein